MVLSRAARKILVGLIILAALAGYGYYYYFVQSLSLSDIMGKSNVLSIDIVVNLLDFDTGLTRFDMYSLSQNSDYWDRRIQEVDAMTLPSSRRAEQDKLMAEMLQDPTLKKIITKTLVLGTSSALKIIQTIL